MLSKRRQTQKTMSCVGALYPRRGKTRAVGSTSVLARVQAQRAEEGGRRWLVMGHRTVLVTKHILYHNHGGG